MATCTDTRDRVTADDHHQDAHARVRAAHVSLIAEDPAGQNPPDPPRSRKEADSACRASLPTGLGATAPPRLAAETAESAL